VGFTPIVRPRDHKFCVFTREAQQLIDTVTATYVILDKFVKESSFNKRLSGLVVNSPGKWRLVYASPRGDFDIFQRVGLNPPCKVAPIVKTIFRFE